MRADAPSLEHVATGLVQTTTVDVWFGGREVAAGVPVGAGRSVVQVDQDVPERVDLSLPREWAGVTLDPGRAGSVLGTDGHRVHVTTTLHTPDGTGVWVLPVGRFQVQSWGRDGAGIRVRADGLLRRVVDHDAAAPRGTAATARVRTEVTRLLGADGIEPYFDPALPDRAVPAGFTWGTDRYASLVELVTVWPARMRAMPDGRVGFFRPRPAAIAAALSWHAGRGGTVVEVPSEGTRGGVHNHLVVRVRPEGDEPESVIERAVTDGRLAVGTYGHVTREISSGAVTTAVQAVEVANAELLRTRLRARTAVVRMVPDWRVQVDDDAEVTDDNDATWWGRVTGLEQPLTNADGPSVVHVGVVD